MSSHAVRYVAHSVEQRVPPGHVGLARIELENTGTLTWEATSPRGDHVGVAVAWNGVVVANHVLPRGRVGPRETVTLRFALEAPLAPGVHRLRIELVQYQVARFEERGSPPLDLDVVVTSAPLDACAADWARAQAHDPWHYLPTRGIARAADGTSFPVFVERAQGCHMWDQSGRRYIDYTMGWGTVLLGYADPRIGAAISAATASGAVVAWPQRVELEVARMLAEDFSSPRVPEPMVCFGKNGSDACTFAVRMARVATGRRTVLFCGYHGWQDFWVEQVGFERTGVPAREPALIHRYGFHDRASFAALYERHRADLAAVMIEPSPWAGDGLGFEGDTDAAFLAEIAAAARAAGAVFILDEILTGYRYPGGSVQRAKRIAPDL
ncbi:MAG: aminotransferase class III-fold pyridoxal phosphate-dependent enzyme, partial [Planctomycetota bacterium]